MLLFASVACHIKFRALAASDKYLMPSSLHLKQRPNVLYPPRCLLPSLALLMNMITGSLSVLFSLRKSPHRLPVATAIEWSFKPECGTGKPPSFILQKYNFHPSISGNQIVINERSVFYTIRHPKNPMEWDARAAALTYCHCRLAECERIDGLNGLLPKQIVCSNRIFIDYIEWADWKPGWQAFVPFFFIISKSIAQGFAVAVRAHCTLKRALQK